MDVGELEKREKTRKDPGTHSTSCYFPCSSLVILSDHLDLELFQSSAPPLFHRSRQLADFQPTASWTTPPPGQSLPPTRIDLFPFDKLSSLHFLSQVTPRPLILDASDTHIAISSLPPSSRLRDHRPRLLPHHLPKPLPPSSSGTRPKVSFPSPSPSLYAFPQPTFRISCPTLSILPASYSTRRSVWTPRSRSTLFSASWEGARTAWSTISSARRRER